MGLTASVLAIDAGNSKTDVAVIAADGTVLGRGRSGGFQPPVVGVEAAVDVLAAAVEAAVADAAAGARAGVPVAAGGGFGATAADARDRGLRRTPHSSPRVWPTPICRPRSGSWPRR